ncbi:right-handed parallel beta-helix repeat-containing protein [Aliiroseovarius sp. S1339]|uniref:right-handed parallel beta-helix repeat-containing protein n=1 Tax=Aliiroseovarius sp. S1339 TaxID=2936990 RepID=UPI0020C1075C|nr:right-handed parallel beta-helix repeat-containing protein [Aliiroseovarius sp. S1339]MCK8465071.1 right-handed parallel beta-helix repeat-containing protein [Aliiroseovarius sp. S1339]
MTIYNVSSRTELYDALKNASGGDVIKLASGDYGHLQLDAKSGFNIKYNSEVTITSANANAPASFSSMELENAKNITFDKIDFDYDFKGEPDHYRAFKIDESSNITLRNGNVDGDNGANGYPTGYGLAITDSSGVTIDNMEISNWHRGIVTSRIQDVEITNNDIHTIGGDGMDFVEVQDVLIANNHIHDFTSHPSNSTHRDMIQFWTRGSDNPSENVRIVNNKLDIGDGAWTQTIFIRNEEVDQGRAGQEMYYRDFLIENNTIINAHTHGITVGETDGLVIKNNTVLTVEGNQSVSQNQNRPHSTTTQIYANEDSKNVSIIDNITAGIRGDQPNSWDVSGNVTPGNANGSAGADTDYTTGGGSNTGDNSGSDDTNTGGSDDTNTGGSDDTNTGGSDDTNTGGSDDTNTGGSDDTNTGGSDDTNTGGSDDTNTGGSDNSDDGGSDNSDNSGSDNVNLSDFLAGFDDHVLDFANLEDNASVEMNGDAFVKDASSIVFDGNRDYVDLGRFEDLEDSEQIAFTVEYARDEADGSKQRLIWNHKKVGLTIDDDGLIVHVANNDAKFHKGFEVEDLGLNDTDLHRVSVIVDQDSDRLQVIVDDTVVLDETDTDFDFVGAGGGEWGWSIGTKWSRFFDGEVTDFRVDDDVDFVEPVVQDDALTLG